MKASYEWQGLLGSTEAASPHAMTPLARGETPREEASCKDNDSGLLLDLFSCYTGHTPSLKACPVEAPHHHNRQRIDEQHRDRPEGCKGLLEVTQGSHSGRRSCSTATGEQISFRTPPQEHITKLIRTFLPSWRLWGLPRAHAIDTPPLPYLSVAQGAGPMTTSMQDTSQAVLKRSSPKS